MRKVRGERSESKEVRRVKIVAKVGERCRG